MTQMEQIRISATGKIREALDILRKNRYPLLSDAEIIKVILSCHLLENTADKESIEKLDVATSTSIAKSRKDIKNGNYQKAGNSSDSLRKLSGSIKTKRKIGDKDKIITQAKRSHFSDK